jgi:hypothetical protein
MTATETASREAFASVQPALNALQMRVFNAIADQADAGLTDEEGQAATGMNPSTYRPRRLELQELGLIQIHPVASKQHRKNTNGRRCAVFVVARRTEP